MAGLDARTEQDLGRFTTDVQAALGEGLVCLALYGSAVDGDFVSGRSDVNTAVVVGHVTPAVLDRLGPVVAPFRRRGFALPLIVDLEYLERARDVFPMELADLGRRHRVLAGRDVFVGLSIQPAALRRACEREARGKQLRLRALYLDTSGEDRLLDEVLVGSLKSFLVLLRHLVVLHGAPSPEDYGATLDAGERLLGPLPAMRRLLAHRTGSARRPPAALRADVAAYLAEVDRIVTAADRAET